MKDNRFYNAVIVPATAYLELGHAAATTIAGEGQHGIEDFDIHAPLVIDEGTRPTVQTVVTEVGVNEALFEIYSCTEDNLAMRNEWKLHASGKLNLNRKDEEQAYDETWPIFQQQVQARCDRALNSVEYYKMLFSKGVDYGPAFKGLEDIRRGNGEAIGRIRVPDILKGECQLYHVHPALLDVCLQILGVALLGDNDLDIGGDLYMPVGLEQYYSDRHAMEDVWIHSMIRSGDNTDKETFVGDIRVFSNDGRVIVHFKGLRFKRTTGETLRCTKQDYISGWFYELQWLDLGPLGRVKDAYPSSGKWLIFSDHHGIGEGLADHLQKGGQFCTMVHLKGEPYGRSNGAFTIDPDCREDFDRLFGDIEATDHMSIDGIVYLQGLDVEVPDPDEPDWEDRADLGCIRVLNLIQAMAAAPWTNPPHLTLVTQGAAIVDNQVDALQPGQAALWGLGRVITIEHPEFQCKLVDLEPETTVEERISSLANEILHCDGRETQIALRQGCRRALRLVRGHPRNQPNVAKIGNHQNKTFQLEISTPDQLIIHDNASYLITGGRGALGLHFASWLAEKGARHLVLVGRKAPGAAAQKVIDRLKASGVEIVVARGDVCKKDDLQRIFDEIDEMPTLKGVIHAAGQVDDGLLCNQNRERFIGVMAPKTYGTWLLHVLTKNRELNFFVMCSAGAAIFGSPGQGNYAAANTFMDAMAHYRRALGLPGLSINWGPWTKGGMADTLSDRDHQRWTSMGMGTIEPAQGILALEMALRHDTPQVAVLPINWPVFFRQISPGDEPLFLSEIAQRERSKEQVADRVVGSGEFLERLKQADPEDRYDLLMDFVRELIINVLCLKPKMGLSQDEGLTDLGMDSLMAVEFSNRLKRTFNLHLPSTIAFEYPTIRALTDHLISELGFETKTSAVDATYQMASDHDLVRASVEQLDDEAVADMLSKELDKAGY